MIFVVTWITSTPSPGEIIKQAERRHGLLRTQARELRGGWRAEGPSREVGCPSRAGSNANRTRLWSRREHWSVSSLLPREGHSVFWPRLPSRGRAPGELHLRAGRDVKTLVTATHGPSPNLCRKSTFCVRG